MQEVSRGWDMTADMRIQLLRGLGFLVVKCDNRYIAAGRSSMGPKLFTFFVSPWKRNLTLFFTSITQTDLLTLPPSAYTAVILVLLLHFLEK